jgi:hypothetical protein
VRSTRFEKNEVLGLKKRWKNMDNEVLITAAFLGAGLLAYVVIPVFS